MCMLSLSRGTSIVCVLLTPGVGLGLIYLPAMVMVGYYFEKHRAVATGIACSGAGIGILILAAVASALLYHFDWKNAMLIMAGFPLQCLLLGGLMRPLDYRSHQSSDDSEANLITTSPSGDGVPDTAKSPQQGINRNIGELSKSAHPAIFGSYDLTLKAGSWDPQNELGEGSCQNGSLKNEFLKGRLLTAEVTSSCHEIPVKSQQHSKLQMKANLLHPEHGDNRAKSCHNLSHHTKGDAEFAKNHHSRPHRKDFDKPLLRKDIFYSGSIYNLPEYKSNPSLHSYLASITKVPASDETSDDADSKSRCPCISESASETLKEMLDFGICSNPYFLILAAGSLFIQLAYYVPIMFIGEYAMSLGISPVRAASLISVMGE